MSGHESNLQRDPVDELAEQFAERLRQGEHPSIDEYTRQHPQWTERIQQVFSALVVIERLKPRPEDNSNALAEVDSTAKQLRQPERIGDYRILREVGRGGMGVVYEAEQTSLGRHVALKVLQSSAVMDSKNIARFEREARAAARLHHTNIVPVFGVGREGNLHYYVMQFIQGQPLDDVLAELKWILKERSSAGATHIHGRSFAGDPKEDDSSRAAHIAVSLLSGQFTANTTQRQPRGPAPFHASALPGQPASMNDSSAVLPGHTDVSSVAHSDATYWRCVARLGVQVAKALEYAHGQGILHRDIKPANLLLDHHGTVWVADFGLAKVSQEEQLTQTGDIVGTLRYMAPEAFQGKYEMRSDTYGLGLTLYEMVALRPAFDAIDRSTLMRQVTSGAIPRLRNVNAAVPRDLETIVMKALEHEPAHRYATNRQLADDLQSFLDDKPIRARRASRAERAWRWSRPNPALAASLAAVAGLLVFLAVAGQLMARRQTALAMRESAARETVRRTLYLSDMTVANQAWKMNDIRHMIALLNRYLPSPNQEDLRGFEWFYLWKLCEPARTAPTFHHEDARHVGFLPDGKTLVTVGPTVRLWAVDAEQQLEPPLHEFLHGVSVVALSPSGQLLTAKPTLGLWKVQSREALVEFADELLAEDSARILSVAISPDDRVVAAGSSDNVVRLWNAANGRLLHKLTGHLTAGNTLAISNDKTLASGSADGEVKLWSIVSGKELPGLARRDGVPNSLAFSPQGNMLALARGKTVELWDLDNLREPHVLEGHTRLIRKVAFSPDGWMVASASDDFTAKLWSVKTLEELRTIRGHSATVFSLGFSPDGNLLATACWDGTTKVWDLTRHRSPGILQGHADWVRTLVFSPDGEALASGGRDGWTRIWNTDTGQEHVTLGQHLREVRVVEFLHEGTILASAGDDNVAKFWDVSTGKQQRAFPFERDVAEWSWGGCSLTISADGKTLAAGTANGGVDLWDAVSGERLQTLDHGNHQVTCVAFSSDRTKIVTGSIDGTVKLWDASSGELVHRLPGHSKAASCVAFSPNGETVAVGSDATDATRLYDAATGEEQHQLIGTENNVYCLAFSPDGNSLVTGTHAGTLKFWDVCTGEERFVLAKLETAIRAVAFSNDGTTLAVGTSAGEIRLWRAATAAEVTARKR